MRPRKFVGATSREVLKQVRDALGPDALIVSNSRNAAGIEVVALPGGAIDRLVADATQSEPAAAPQPAPAPAPAAPERRDPVFSIPSFARPSLRRQRAVEPEPALRRAPAAAPVPSPLESPAAATANGYDLAAASRPRPAPAPAPAPVHAAVHVAPPTPPAPPAPQAPAQPVPPAAQVAYPAPAGAVAAPAAPVMDEALVSTMVAELRTMRSMLEHQLAGLAWNELARRDPGKIAVMRALLAAGFTGETVRRLTEPMPEIADEREALRWAGTEINRNLVTAGSDNDIIERGGVYALMGPTGVGKTTTTAKLAARCVVRHGADRVALLTTDTYRIGAHEQLRIYGRILGVTTCVVKDANDLKLTLADLRSKHMVLIDTVGMSQRDQQVAEQVATLTRSGGNVKRLLLLNATCNAETLDDVVRCYEPSGLDGCVVTKLDEAGSIGAVLDVIIRNRLVLHFVANGQRVPEDLHVPNRQYLIHRALKAGTEGAPQGLTEAEYPLMLSVARGVSRQLDEIRTPLAGGRLA